MDRKMGLTDTTVRPDHTDSFWPDLSLSVAPTWWQLGARLSKRGDSKALQGWVQEIKANLYETEAAAVTLPALKQFADTVYRLLNQKFDGQPIAAEVRELIKVSNDFDFKDDDQYLDAGEPDGIFWANEYRELFTDIYKTNSRNDRGWLEAVDRCIHCGTFFVKSRIDQKFDSAACRVKYLNAKSYRAKTTLMKRAPKPQARQKRAR